MEETYEITKAELIETFRKWNVEYIKNPSKFDELDESEETAEAQADYFLRLLNKS